MTSAIDPTTPVYGNPTTESVRDNFAAAKAEIEDLQDVDVDLDARVTALEGGGGGGGGGGMAQQVIYSTGALWTGSTPMPADDTIPQITEGAQFAALAITPADAASILEIEAVINASPGTSSAVTIATFVDTTADAIAAQSLSIVQDYGSIIVLKAYISAGSTTERTYQLRIGQSASGTVSINGWASARKLGGAYRSIFTVKEWTPA